MRHLFVIRKPEPTLPCSVVAARRGPAPEFSRHTVIKPRIYHGREKREIASTREKDVSIALKKVHSAGLSWALDAWP
jgi:hypothetical protein